MHQIIVWYSPHRIILNVYCMREATHPETSDVMSHHILCHTAASHNMPGMSHPITILITQNTVRKFACCKKKLHKHYFGYHSVTQPDILFINMVLLLLIKITVKTAVLTAVLCLLTLLVK